MRNLFKKDSKKQTKKEELKNLGEGQVSNEGNEETADLSAQAGSSMFSSTGGMGAHKVLRGFYISEKASMGSSDSQYTFSVFKKANKSEVKKEVSKLFNVQVKSVKILNMPEKRRDFGKHPGSRSGFKKAIVVLKEGFTIGQVKP